MDFGAFVNILPGKDGLVHISQISNERVNEVSDVLSEGDVVKVKVMEVDAPRKRIALSMRLSDNASDYQAEKATPRGERKPRNSAPRQHSSQPQTPASNNPMAALFAQAQKKKGKRL
jgi:uncharacterized protein